LGAQAEFWNDAGGLSWVRAQDKLDVQLAPYGALALDAARLHEGDVVLDVGCGCGATTAELAKLVGSEGRVVGLDVSAPMLARARELVTLPQVEFVLGDAATHDLPLGSFDLLFSRFGVMFFEEPVRAFAHLRGALKRNGRVSLVVWQAVSRNAWVTIPAAAVHSIVGPLSLGGPDEPGPFSLADPDHLHEMLVAAGYEDVSLSAKELDFVVGAGLPLADAVTFTMDNGPLRRVLGSASPDVRAAAGELLAEALAPFDTGSGVRFSSAVWVVTANAP
jgi:SAM-dependent methyltransferase